MSSDLQKKGLYQQPLMDALQKLGFTTFGDVWFVNPDTGDDDSYDGKTEQYPFATVQAAIDAATSNQDDVIVLSAYAAHPVAAMLDITKSRLHFISAGHRPGSIGMGARTRLVMGVTTAATDIAVMKNTGVGNTFQGIKFDSSNTVDESLYSVVEGGEYAIYQGCEFYKSSDLDVTGAAEVVNNGDSAQWINCTFGSSINQIADGVIRANMLVTQLLAGSGKYQEDTVIDNCLFLSYSGGEEQVKIYGANATDVGRAFIVKNSVFFNNPNSQHTPAHAVGFGAAQTRGGVLLKGCTSIDHTVMAQASRNIYVDGAVPVFATTGVSKAA